MLELRNHVIDKGFEPRGEDIAADVESVSRVTKKPVFNRVGDLLRSANHLALPRRVVEDQFADGWRVVCCEAPQIIAEAL